MGAGFGGREVGSEEEEVGEEEVEKEEAGEGGKVGGEEEGEW